MSHFLHHYNGHHLGPGTKATLLAHSSGLNQCGCTCGIWQPSQHPRGGFAGARIPRSGVACHHSCTRAGPLGPSGYFLPRAGCLAQDTVSTGALRRCTHKALGKPGILPKGARSNSQRSHTAEQPRASSDTLDTTDTCLWGDSTNTRWLLVQTLPLAIRRWQRPGTWPSS